MKSRWITHLSMRSLRSLVNVRIEGFEADPFVAIQARSGGGGLEKTRKLERTLVSLSSQQLRLDKSEGADQNVSMCRTPVS